MKSTAIALALLISGAARAEVPSHYDLIRTTPCLYEYRTWFYTFRHTAEFIPPPGLTSEQCARALEVNRLIGEERASADEIMDGAPKRSSDPLEPCLREVRAWRSRAGRDETFEGALETFPPFRVMGSAYCTKAAALADELDKQTHERERVLKAEADRARAAQRAQEARSARQEAREKAARDEQRRKPSPRLGMSLNEVWAGTNWGAPTGKTRRTTAAGVTEVWSYGAGNYLTFVDGKLVAITEDGGR